MTQENLLELISKDINHAFHNVLKISNDYNKITTFCGKERLVYTEKKSYLEVLGRQILVDTYLKDEKSYYLEEEQEEDGCRSDLLTKLLQTEQKQNVIEIKSLSSNILYSMFKTELDNAFTQVEQKYLKNNGDSFVSIVFMDVEKIVKNTKNLEKFKTLNENGKIDDDKKGWEKFKDFGFFIVTRKYLKSTGRYDPTQVWFDIPKHCLIEVNREEKELDEFGVPQKVANIKDAIKFPSASSSYGIKNVRDIKDPEEDERKKELLFSIFKTAIKSFKKNDVSLINKRGKEKDFVYIKKETIINSYTYKDKSFFSLTTLNGAIVDGQNSIDCFRIIIDFISGILSNKKIETQPPYYKKMLEILNSDGTYSERDINEFRTFIESVKISIKPTATDSVEDAINIAINKNNTMPVTISELKMSQNMNAIQVISNQILIDDDLIIGYPKKNNFGVSSVDKSKNYIGFSKLANIAFVYEQIKNGSLKESKDIYDLKSKITKPNYIKALESLIENYSEQKEMVDGTEIKDTENELDKNRIEKEAAETIKANCERILSKYPDDEDSQEDLEKAEEQISKYKIQRKILIEKKKAQSIVSFVPKNTKELSSIMKIYLKVESFMNNEIDLILNNIDLYKFYKDKKNSQKDSIIGYITVILFNMSLKNKNFPSERSSKRDDIFKDVIMKVINGIFKVEIVYGISITVLTRTNNIQIQKSNGETEDTSKIMSEYFGNQIINY